MNNKELLKLQLEKLSFQNKSEYYQKRNNKLVAEICILESELDMLYKRIELCKKFCNKKRIKLRDGKEGFDCYSGVSAVINILNGTSNFAKLENLKEYDECEVLNE